MADQDPQDLLEKMDSQAGLGQWGSQDDLGREVGMDLLDQRVPKVNEEPKAILVLLELASEERWAHLESQVNPVNQVMPKMDSLEVLVLRERQDKQDTRALQDPRDPQDNVIHPSVLILPALLPVLVM